MSRRTNLDRDDISKFYPAVHHYRREHAQNRLYLPSDITVTDMHADFCREVKRVCLETYRKEVERMNISFAVLDAEECETCKKHPEHMDDRSTAENCGCERCQHHSEHIRRRDEARAAYKMDAGRTPDDQEVITSVDLQKVMMLPCLPGVKLCAFTRRIVVLNETFAGLGTSRNNAAVVWNDLFLVETPMTSALHIGTSSRGRGLQNPSSCGAIIAAPRIKIGLFSVFLLKQ